MSAFISELSEIYFECVCSLTLRDFSCFFFFMVRFTVSENTSKIFGRYNSLHFCTVFFSFIIDTKNNSP